jgi:hypothetical protein
VSAAVSQAEQDATGASYYAGRFADVRLDQHREIWIAARVARVHLVDVLALLLAHPQLDEDMLAHLTLRVVLPPGISVSGTVGYITPGRHTDAIDALERSCPLAKTLVELARTWRGSVADLATVGVGIAGPLRPAPA